MSTSALMSIAMRRGALSKSEALAHDMFRWLRANLRALPECASVIEVVLARVYLARNQLAQARAAVDRAAAIDPYPTSLNVPFLSHMLHAHILNAQGDWAGARVAIRAVRELPPYGGRQMMNERDAALQEALILLRQENLPAAEQLLRYELPPRAPQEPEKVLYMVAWAELQLRRGQFADAEASLAQADKAPGAVLIYAVTPQLLLALAYWGQDKSRRALDALLAVVRIAEPEDMTRPFLDCGARLIPLLAFAARAGSLSVAQQRFVTNLLDTLRAAHPDAPPPAAADLDRRAAAATISPREQELLGVLAEGLTNREIAARLVLEESTIRTHLRNIYRKLGVNSRVRAIQRARELGLL